MGRRKLGWVLITLACGALAEESAGYSHVLLETNDVSSKSETKTNGHSKSKILPLFLDDRF